MKPNFTLSLAFDGIRLLHRVPDGWRLVGEVPLDSADLAAELAVLRKTATSLEPGGLRSLLLIPDAQIRYLTVETPGQDAAARHAAAAKALEGATPYDVADLVYDVSGTGSQTQVAAVARETLEEAEAFALEHRFHPVAFTAAPSADVFDGVPDFGKTNAAAGLLDPGETVEPETAPVVARSIAAKAITVGTEDTPAAPSTDAENAQDDDMTEVPVGPELAPTPAASTPPLETDLTTPEDSPRIPDTKVAGNPDTPPDLASTPDRSPPPRVEPLPEFAAPETPPAAGEASSTGSVAGSTAPLAAVAAEESKGPSRKVDFSAPAVRSAPGTGFVSRRDTARIAGGSAPSLGGASRATPLTPSEGPAATVASVPLAAPSPAAAPLAPQIPVGAAAETPPQKTANTPQGTETTPPAAPVQPDSSSLDSAAPLPGGRFLSRRKPKPARTGRRLTPAALAAPTAASEAERMTIFGARRREQVGGKPRFLGLMLTAALLLFLAGVAAWASIFLDNGTALSRLFGDRSPESAVLAPSEVTEAEPLQPTEDEAGAEAEEIAVLPPGPEGPDAIETAALDAGLTDEDGAVLDALRRPDPRPISEMTEAELDARYATTGIWPRAPQVPPAPPGAVDLDDLYLTSIDPISTSTDAIALPPVTAYETDPYPGVVASPAAAGTQFALDPRGLVTPTAQGAVSPDGHLVYLGRPAAVPPATMARREVVPLETQTPSPLIDARPRPRPDDLSETTERAQLGLTRNELAALRPQPRPQSLREQAAAAVAAETPEDQPPASPIDTSDAVAAALATPPAIENATRQATTASRRPDIRPRNFARIVDRAEESQPTEVATIAPKAVQPRFPSKTSVAREATSKNAINLRQINLIGVYGKPSSRRALVRLSNGRYQKVEVGDRIDGGRVAAIGDSELRYVRRGRNVVLRMPE